MKCPKCGYLGFEHVDRCRNCGYDFSLSESLDLPELALRSDTHPMDPLDDLVMLDRAAPLALRFEPAMLEAPVAERPAGAKPRLPLFGDDLEPLITRASPPRQPLAVRRASPEIPRLRSDQLRGQTLELELDAPPPSYPPTDLVAQTSPMNAVNGAARERHASWPQAVGAPQTVEDAGLGARLAAALIDVLLLGSVDVLVIYFTMQICGVGMWDLGVVPKGPLLVFMLVQNGGYLVAFTAGGQTLGKLVIGIKVVSADAGSPLDLGRAVVRTAIWLILAAPMGLGFLTTALSHDHRGFHDRVARTRVVRAA